LREVLWPTDISTLDVDAMVVRETTHRFSRLSFHRAMVGRRLPLLLTASGLTWLAFAPDHERQAMIESRDASGRGVSAGAGAGKAGGNS
jgi:IclR family mhp operon transcriptional activator